MLEANEINSAFYALRLLSHGLDTAQVEVTEGEEYPASEFTKEEQEQALKIIHRIEESESVSVNQLAPDKIDYYVTALADRIEKFATSDLVNAGYTLDTIPEASPETAETLNADAIGQQEPESIKASLLDSNSTHGSGTVLLIEDEDIVRELTSVLLEERGYVVLEAIGGEEAIILGREHEEPIDLLITDVVMPTMSGKEVAEQLRKIHPEMNVLFMSGYTDEAIVQRGVIDSDIAFIQKPFSERTLTQKVRDVLDAKTRNA